MKIRVGLLVLAGLSTVGWNCAGAVPGDQNWDSRFGLAPGFNGTIRAFAVVGTNLFVGGDFTRVGELEASGVVRWDGTRWDALKGGVNAWGGLGYGYSGWLPSVRCLATDGTNLYAGGRFFTAGGVAATNLACWDGQTWSELGSQFQPWDLVETLTANGSTLYVGGSFNSVAGVAATNIAVWNGSRWSALGEGLQDLPLGFGGLGQGTVNALLLDRTNLFAGGTFKQSGTLGMTNIARWDGSQWHPLGEGRTGDYSDSVGALALVGGRVLVGGRFTGAGGVATTNLAWWDGATWSAFPTDSKVNPSRFLSDGAGVIVFGTFTNVGGTGSSAIARFDGTNWAGFGSGIVGTVHAATWFGTNLIVGGEFQLAGGKSAGFIAKWDGHEWQSLFPGKGGALFGWPTSMTANSNGVYVAGSLVSAGETPVECVAHFDGNRWTAMDKGLLPGAWHLLSSVGTNSCLMRQGGACTALPIALMLWNGTTWSQVTSNLAAAFDLCGPKVTCLVSGDSGLFVAGNFRTTDGEPATNLVRWDGAQWRSLGYTPFRPPFGGITTMAAHGDTLFIAEHEGGMSPSPGDTNSIPATNNIRCWDGTDWLNIGSNVVFAGENDAVEQLVCMGPDLYAGGHFVATNPVVATNLLRWDGSAWHAVDSPFVCTNSWITSMATSGANLYVRGWCGTSTGYGSTAPAIAKWDGNKWSELGSGLQSSGRAVGAARAGPGAPSDLVAVGREVYMWGGFTSAGGKPSYQFALWHEFPTVTLEPRGWLPNGHFGLSISGCAGQTVDCQSSSNLADWVSFGSQTPDADPYEFEDGTTNTNTVRFYRVLLVP